LSVQTAQTGETVVRVVRSISPADLADRVYGDPELGPALATLARVAPDASIPPGTVLVLPPREELEGRLRVERATEEHFERGLAAADEGRFREAADLFRRALDSAPHRLDVRYNLGLALMRAGDLPEATPHLEAVAAARPMDAESRYALGSLLRKRRAYERALAEFQAVLDLEPRHPAAQFALARTVQDLGRDREARRQWKRFLRRYPDDPLVPSAQRHLDRVEERIREGTGG
jgi:tetratricopeptide (TPR) repeat protein